MSSVFEQNIEAAIATLESIRGLEPQVEQAQTLMRQCLLDGHKILACGNGGSAADAAHLTTEFVVRFVEHRPGYPAICLNTHGGDMTAMGNDYTFDELFARQVQAFGKPGDVLIALSTSGNSQNIVRALEEAKERGVKSIALLGRDGGRCRGLADVELCVAAGVTARIQEAHKLLIHTLCEVVDAALVQASRQS